jgi:hypothetical protein
MFFFFFNYIRRSFLQLSIDFCLNRLRINGVEGDLYAVPGAGFENSSRRLSRCTKILFFG